MTMKSDEKSILGLRMSRAEQKSLVTRYGKFMAKTGKHLSLSEFILIETCNKLNVEAPQFECASRVSKSKLKQFQINLSTSLHKKIAATAEQNNISSNRLVLDIVAH